MILATKTYGPPPYSVVVVHGGPGAPGEMAPVARELSNRFGVIEPLQSATTVEGQIAELVEQICEQCDHPVVIIGYSWGAWLAYLVAAKFPEVVSKLILVGSGPFDVAFVDEMRETRRSRLSPEERSEHESLTKNFAALDDAGLSRLGELSRKTDLFDPLDAPSELLDCDSEAFKNVWPEAAALRASGELLALAKKTRCPVAAIHGTHDPHPAQGVELPLRSRLSQFDFFPLEKCGHTPWLERQAKSRFFDILIDLIEEYEVKPASVAD